jgi:hypothetical protein
MTIRGEFNCTKYFLKKTRQSVFGQKLTKALMRMTVGHGRQAVIVRVMDNSCYAKGN